MNDVFQQRKRAKRRWRFFWIGLGLLTLTGIGGVIAMGAGETVVGKNSLGQKSHSPAGLAAAAALAGAADRDNDGLKDWEEEIYQTSPTDADSDRDGTPDGDEVAANRNPLIAGPNDTATDNPALYGSAEDNVSARILAAVQNSLTPELIAGLEQGTADPEALRSLTDTLSSIDPNTLVPAPVVTKRDITITDASGKAAARDYFNAVADVVLDVFTPLRGKEIEVIKKIGEDGDLAHLNGLDQIITAYTSAIQRIRVIPVPKEYESFALQEITNLMYTRDLLQAIHRSDNDPIRAAILLEQRGRLAADIRAFHERTSSELITKKVPFSATDSGRAYIDDGNRS